MTEKPGEEDLKALLKAGHPVVVDGVLLNEPMVAAWVNEKLGGGLVPTMAQSFGVLKDGVDYIPSANQLPNVLIAGAYFFNYHDDLMGTDPKTGEQFTWAKVMVTVYADDISAARPQVFRTILRWPFIHWGCDFVTAEIDMANARAIRQAQLLGFKLIGRQDSLRPGGSVGIFGMRKDWCTIKLED